MNLEVVARAIAVKRKRLLNTLEPYDSRLRLDPIGPLSHDYLRGLLTIEEARRLIVARLVSERKFVLALWVRDGV